MSLIMQSSMSTLQPETAHATPPRLLVRTSEILVLRRVRLAMDAKDATPPSVLSIFVRLSTLYHSPRNPVECQKGDRSSMAVMLVSVVLITSAPVPTPTNLKHPPDSACAPLIVEPVTVSIVCIK
eukprot:2675243-Prymnesium_polylepis.1